MFASLDADGSGSISREEFAKLMQQMQGQAQKHRTLLGGSGYLVTSSNCTYNCTYNHIRALKGLISES